MKRRIMLSCSLMVLAVLLAAGSAPAQTFKKYQAHIPFDFAVGKVTYEAGDYTVRLQGPTSQATIFTLADADGRELQAAAVIRNGATSEDEKTMLVFERLGYEYVLKQIVSPEFGFWAPQNNRVIRLAANPRQKPDTVAVALITLD